MADSVHAPLYYASGILRDGRVIVAGGEYDAGAMVWLLNVEIYNPVANTWTTLPVPAGWMRIGDAPGCVLPDGRFFVGQVATRNTAIYDPVTNTWTAAANKINTCRRGELVAAARRHHPVVDCSNPPNAEKYIIASNEWVAAGATPQVARRQHLARSAPRCCCPTGACSSSARPASRRSTRRRRSPTRSARGCRADDPPGQSWPAAGYGRRAGVPAAQRQRAVQRRADHHPGGLPGADLLLRVRPGRQHASPRCRRRRPPRRVPYWGRMLMLPNGQVMYTTGCSAIVDALHPRRRTRPGVAPDDHRAARRRSGAAAPTRCRPPDQRALAVRRTTATMPRRRPTTRSCGSNRHVVRRLLLPHVGVLDDGPADRHRGPQLRASRCRRRSRSAATACG